MSKPSQSVELKDLGYRKEIEAWVFGKKPSWKNHGEGSAQIRVSLEKDGGIYIIASEHSFGGEGKRTASKEVFVTLPVEGAKLLKQMLNERTDI